LEEFKDNYETNDYEDVIYKAKP